MAWYHAELIVRDRPGGTGENSVSVQAYRHADDTTIGSAVLTSTVNGVAGAARFLLATTSTTGTSFELHPGPYYLQLTHNGETQTHSSQDVGSAGVIDLYSQVLLNKAMGNGIIQNPDPDLDELECSADGLDMTVDIDKGAFTIQGIPGFNHLARAITIGANSSGDDRIDTIVIEVVPRGQATEGKQTIKVIEGTPAGSPVAPTLTQDETLWQEPLCDVAVDDGVSVIQLADITDRRDLIERAVSDVEDNIVALEAAVDALETITALPLLDCAGVYSGTWAPAALAPDSGQVTTVTVTGAQVGDIVLISHTGTRSNNFLVALEGLVTGANTVQVVANNRHPTAVMTLGTGTLTVVAMRPVTS